MAVSNSIGSNVFDILIGIGAVYFVFLLLKPDIDYIAIDTANLLVSIAILFGTVLLLIGMLLLNKWQLGKKSGWMLIIIYLVYVTWTVLQVV